MLERSQARTIVVLSLVVLAGLAGCRPKPVEQIPEPPAVPPEREAPAPRQEPEEVYDPWARDQPTKEDVAVPPDEFERAGRLRAIYFAFDSSELSPESRATLRENAEWLKAHAGRRLVIEGHCDERGTIEYNLALGERRANAVRDYLSSLGLARDRLRIVTYGEERPASPGHDETAWARNRRAEFVLER